MPSLATMEHLAGVLGVDFAELFRFRERDTAKDKETERLLAVVRGRSASDIEMIADIAARIFGR
jgi:transcriptional regulator with XRE-family HTH domain